MALAAARRRSAVAVSQSNWFAAEMAALADESDTRDAWAAAGSGAGGSAVTSRPRPEAQGCRTVQVGSTSQMLYVPIPSSEHVPGV